MLLTDNPIYKLSNSVLEDTRAFSSCLETVHPLQASFGNGISDIPCWEEKSGVNNQDGLGNLTDGEQRDLNWNVAKADLEKRWKPEPYK